jgi:hypothetical protein
MYVHITGFTEPNSTVTIDGIVAATGPDGSFDAYANMKCGANVYTLEAKDRAGNVKRGTIRVVRVDKEADNTDKLVALGVLAAAAIVYIGILLWQANKNGYMDPAKRFFGEMKESAKEAKDVELVGSERPGEVRSASADAPGGVAPVQQPPGPQALMIGPPDEQTATAAAISAAPQTKANRAEKARQANEMAQLNALMSEEAEKGVEPPTKEAAPRVQAQPTAKEKPTRPEVGPFKITPQGTKVRIAKGRPGPGPARGGGGPRREGGGRGAAGGGRGGAGGREGGGGARQAQRQRRR